MRCSRRIFLSSIILITLAFWLILAFAQNWTSSEQEIWNLEKNYLTHLKQANFQDLSKFWHERFIGWPSHSSNPVHRDDGIASLEELLHSTKILSFNFSPLAIQNIRDIALVHYRVDFEIVNTEGDNIKNSYRITHTWLKEKGKWKILGGMSSRLDNH